MKKREQMKKHTYRDDQYEDIPDLKPVLAYPECALPLSPSFKIWPQL